MQGTFGDPYYGGNANFVGWDLIGYPGVRTVRRRRRNSGCSSQLTPIRTSAYDHDDVQQGDGSSAKPAGSDRHGD